MPWQGRPQPAAPGLGVAQDGHEGLAAFIRLDGGWAWKGPGHPVDNGDLARGQRDGLRSEGAARVLFFPGFLPGRGRVRHESEDSFVVFTGGRALREAGSAVLSRSGDIMACTVCDLTTGRD